MIMRRDCECTFSQASSGENILSTRRMRTVDISSAS